MNKHKLNRLVWIRSVLAGVCSLVAGCHDPSLPHPPIVLPFDAQYEGQMIEFEFEVEKEGRYVFDLRFLYNKENPGERAYLSDSIRRETIHKAGRVLHVGLSLPLHMILEKSDVSGSYEILEDRKFRYQVLTSWGADRFNKEIFFRNLDVGWYRVKILSLASLDNPQSLSIALGLYRFVRK